MDEQKFWEIVDSIIDLLPKQPSDDSRFWTDGNEILCSSEIECEKFADILDLIAEDQMAHTGYYDPDEDYRSGEVDDHTGFYYINFD